MEFPITTKTKRTGVNLQEFLAKRTSLSVNKPKDKAVENKPMAVAVSNIPKPIKKEVENKKKNVKNHSENSEKLEVNLFKFINASRIVEKDKLLSFVKWFGIPKEVKRLKTQSEFATAFGLSIDTLTDWKKLNGFYKEVELYHSSEMKRFMPDIGMSIVKSAKKGNAKSAELFLKYYMGWSEKVKVEDIPPERVITAKEKAEIERALTNIGLATIIKHDKENND